MTGLYNWAKSFFSGGNSCETGPGHEYQQQQGTHQQQQARVVPSDFNFFLGRELVDEIEALPPNSKKRRQLRNYFIDLLRPEGGTPDRSEVLADVNSMLNNEEQHHQKKRERDLQIVKHSAGPPVEPSGFGHLQLQQLQRSEGTDDLIEKLKVVHAKNVHGTGKEGCEAAARMEEASSHVAHVLIEDHYSHLNTRVNAQKEVLHEGVKEWGKYQHDLSVERLAESTNRWKDKQQEREYANQPVFRMVLEAEQRKADRAAEYELEKKKQEGLLGKLNPEKLDQNVLLQMLMDVGRNVGQQAPLAAAAYAQQPRNNRRNNMESGSASAAASNMPSTSSSSPRVEEPDTDEEGEGSGQQEAEQQPQR